MGFLQGLAVPNASILVATAKPLDNLQGDPPIKKKRMPIKSKPDDTSASTYASPSRRRDGSRSSKCKRRDSMDDDPSKKGKGQKESGLGNHLWASSPNSLPEPRKVGEYAVKASLAVAHLSHSMDERLKKERATSLWAKQKLDDAALNVIQSHAAKIQQAKPHLYVWYVECKISQEVHGHWVKAYEALIAECNPIEP